MCWYHAVSERAWVLQIGRNLTDAFSGFLRGKSFHIMDRDASFHEAFRDPLEQAGIRAVRTPPRSPLISSAFTAHFKREVADRMIFFGEALCSILSTSFLNIITKKGIIRGLTDGLSVRP
jgi:hypothetical protein